VVLLEDTVIWYRVKAVHNFAYWLLEDKEESDTNAEETGELIQKSQGKGITEH